MASHVSHLRQGQHISARCLRLISRNRCKITNTQKNQGCHCCYGAFEVAFVYLQHPNTTKMPTKEIDMYCVFAQICEERDSRKEEKSDNRNQTDEPRRTDFFFIISQLL